MAKYAITTPCPSLLQNLAKALSDESGARGRTKNKEINRKYVNDSPVFWFVYGTVDVATNNPIQVPPAYYEA